MSINIKKSHKGRLHDNLDVPLDQPIPNWKLMAAKASKNPAVRKQAQFAINAKKWKK